MAEPTITLPAISVWQPWASLWVRGFKELETRDYAPPPRLLGQRIAIHATARKPTQADLGCILAAIPRSCPPPEWVAGADLVRDFARGAGPRHGLGAIIATGVLVAAYRFGDETVAGRRQVEDYVADASYWKVLRAGSIRPDPFGHFLSGRWGWRLQNIHLLPEPLPAKGYQTIGWSCALPAHLIPEATDGR